MNDLEAIPDNVVQQIKEIIKNESGIVINDDRLIDFEIVMRVRIANNKMSPEEYVSFFKSNDDEVITVASFFTIQESSFYRNKNHYDRLKSVILPNLRMEKQAKNSKTIRILSAGCATGEEPYTLAMILNDLFYDSQDWNIEITATDINKKAIEYAAEGNYTVYKLRNIDDYYKNRYFDVIKEQKNVLYRVKDSLRKFITFRQCNLIKEPFMLRDLQNVDIIFCENVMIYFCQESVQRLIQNFYSILANDGFLFLGYSETLNMVNHRFTLTWWNDSFAYQKKEGADTGDVIEDNTAILNRKPYESVNEIGNMNLPYKDFMMLVIQNFKKGHVKNVSIILEEIESRIKELKEDFYIIKAEYLLDGGDFMNAGNLCRNAITIDPHCIDAHIILSDIYLRIGMLDKAEFEIKSVIYYNEAYALAYYYLALYYQKLNDRQNYLINMKNAAELAKKKGGLFGNYLYPVNEGKRNEIQKIVMNA